MSALPVVAGLVVWGCGSEQGDTDRNQATAAAVCPAATTSCPAGCVDVLTDANHCGGCGLVCELGLVCQQGACVSPCEPGLLACSTGCVDVTRDSSHCGACEAMCPPEQICSESLCSAPVSNGGTGGSGGLAHGGAGGTQESAGAGGSFEAPPPPPPPELVPAAGVNVAQIEVNQGTAVRVFEEGATIEISDRNAPLVEGRPMLVRASWELEPDFVPRPIEALLTLEYEGEIVIHSEIKWLAEPANSLELGGTYNWLLEANEVRPLMGYSIAFFEVDPALAPAEPPATPPRVPLDGTLELGVEAGPMTLKVVVVPAITSSGFPEFTPPRIERLAEHIWDLFPLQTVTLDVREPMMITDESDTGELFGDLRELCESEDLPSDYFYHMILNGEDGDFDFAGVAAGTISQQNRCRGVALTLVRPDDDGDFFLNDNVNTFAHEIGHNLGRAHVSCGGAAGADDDFPYEEGFLGTQGFSLSDKQLKNVDEYRELMGYCRPRWISDWMYTQLAERIREVSSWELEADARISTGRSLVGYVAPGGSGRWMITRAVTGLEAEQSVQTYAQIHTASGSTAKLPVALTPASDERTIEVTVALPVGFDRGIANVVVNGEAHTVDLGTIRHY